MTVCWEGWVAIATLLLFGATLWNAWLTRAIAKASREEQAALWRPLIIADADVLRVGPPLAVGIQNVGRGPALSVQAKLAQSAARLRSGPTGVLEVEGTVTLEFIDVHLSSSDMTLLLEYDDLSGRTYYSVITLQAVAGKLSINNVHFPKKPPSPISQPLTRSADGRTPRRPKP